MIINWPGSSDRLAASLDFKLAVPAGFLFGFKVTGTLTIKKFPNLPRFGVRAGQMNQDFLNSELFTTTFLGPCEEISVIDSKSLPVLKITHENKSHRINDNPT